MTTGFVSESHILLAFLASFLAGGATAIGSLTVLVIRHLTKVFEDILLSIAAGIMLAASVFSLILPGIEYGKSMLHNEFLAVAIVTAGIGIGALLLWLLHNLVPHEHLHMGREGPEAARLKRIWLFVFAIILHNLPEGISVGVGMMQEDVTAGIALAIGIGLQNIPEGLAVSAVLLTVGYRRSIAIWVGIASGMVEPIGGLFGAVSVWLAESLLPLFLGGAGGAMLYVILDEIIPETHRRGENSHITFAMLGGFSVMLFLEVLLG